jgi:hypothetical protein
MTLGAELASEASGGADGMVVASSKLVAMDRAVSVLVPVTATELWFAWGMRAGSTVGVGGWLDVAGMFAGDTRAAASEMAGAEGAPDGIGRLIAPVWSEAVINSCPGAEAD